MPRLVLFAAVGLLLAIPPVTAAEASPAGSWKLPVPLGQGPEAQFLLTFKHTDGKWTGEYGGSSAALRVEPKLTRVSVDGATLRFTLKIDDRDLATFEGLVASDGQKISGNLSVLGGPTRICVMRPTKLKKLDDAYALGLEAFSQLEDGPGVFDLGFELLASAAEKKVPVEQVRGIVERITRVAGEYGPRWERNVTLQLAEALLGQAGLSDVALAQARRAERMLTDADDASTVLDALHLVARSLTLAGKPEDAKPYTARIAKLEARDYQDYLKEFPNFKFMPYAGRKAKSERTALVEVLSGTSLPTSAGLDLAADALQRTFKPTEAIVLHLHYHLNGLDPLTTPENVVRIREYARKLMQEQFPFATVDGKVVATGGGLASDAEKQYQLLRKAVEEDLEKPATVQLTLTSEKGDKGITLKAAVKDLAMPGETMMLRFAVAEPKVRYVGLNGLRYHHMVVRAWPGGAKGFALTKKDQEQAVTFNTEDIRKEITKHLETVTRSEGAATPTDPPLALTGLKAVAFVQNDATGEVLQAVQIDLEKP